METRIFKGEEVVSKLKCWYDDRHHSYFRLMPIRVEQHSFDPVVYTFHNILSDKEIERLIELAKPRVYIYIFTYKVNLQRWTSQR